MGRGLNQPAWLTHAATRTGPHHRTRQEPNQDAYAHAVLDEALVVAVADGAGSLPRSGEGAQLATTVAVQHVLGRLQGDPNVHHDALADIVDEAAAAARSAILDLPFAREAGCTLTLVVATEAGWAACLVGDSFAVLDHGDRYELLRPDAAGEYANITRLLTSADPDPWLFSGPHPVTGVAASSDGLAWATLDRDEPHAAFYRPLFTRAAADDLDLDGLFAHMDTAGKLDDDTTLVVATRRPGALT